MWSFIRAVGSSGGDDEGHCWSQLGGYCLTGLWVLCRLKGWAVLEQSKCLFSAKQGENTWLSIVDWHKDDCGCYECILCADMGFLCSWDCPWESLGKSLTVSLSQKGEELPSPSPEEEAGTLVLQHAGFPGDLVTLFELLIPLKREDIGKHSLIPTAERRKRACNCLCFLPCWAVKFALCMLGNLISPWAWLKGGYCNLLVAQGKARYVTLLLRSTGWYSPCLPPSHALGRALWLTVIAGGRDGVRLDLHSGLQSVRQCVALVLPQQSWAIGESLAGQQEGQCPCLQVAALGNPGAGELLGSWRPTWRAIALPCFHLQVSPAQGLVLQKGWQDPNLLYWTLWGRSFI